MPGLRVKEQIEVPIELIVIESRFRLRPDRELEDNRLQSLYTSIKTEGLKEPLWVLERVIDGKYVVIDGHRRYTVLNRLASEDPRFKSVPVEVLEGDEDELLKLAIVRNINARTFDPIAKMKSIEALSRMGMPQGDIAEFLGISHGYVSDICRILELEPLRKKVEYGELALKHARDLLRCRDPLRALELVEELNLSPDDIKEITRAELWEHPDLPGLVRQKRELAEVLPKGTHVALGEGPSFRLSVELPVHGLGDWIQRVFAVLETITPKDNCPLEDFLAQVEDKYDYTTEKHDLYHWEVKFRLKGPRRGVLQAFSVCIARSPSDPEFEKLHLLMGFKELVREILLIASPRNNDAPSGKGET